MQPRHLAFAPLPGQNRMIDALWLHGTLSKEKSDRYHCLISSTVGDYPYFGLAEIISKDQRRNTNGCQIVKLQNATTKSPAEVASRMEAEIRAQIPGIDQVVSEYASVSLRSSSEMLARGFDQTY